MCLVLMKMEISLVISVASKLLVNIQLEFVGLLTCYLLIIIMHMIEKMSACMLKKINIIKDVDTWEFEWNLVWVGMRIGFDHTTHIRESKAMN